MSSDPEEDSNLSDSNKLGSKTRRKRRKSAAHLWSRQKKTVPAKKLAGSVKDDEEGEGEEEALEAGEPEMPEKAEPLPCTLDDCTICQQQQTAYCFLHFHKCYFIDHKCIACGVLSLQLVGEYGNHSGCTELKCVFCAETFSAVQELQDHDCQADVANSNQCGLCANFHDSLASLYHHLVDIHCGVKTVKCDLCEAIFTNNNTLEIHKKSFHKNNKSVAKFVVPKRSPAVLQKIEQLKKGIIKPRVKSLPSILRKRKIEDEPVLPSFDDDGDQYEAELVEISQDKKSGSKLFRYVTPTAEISRKDNLFNLLALDQDFSSDEEEEHGDKSESVERPTIKLKPKAKGSQALCTQETCVTCFDRQAALCMYEFHKCPVLDEDSVSETDCIVCKQVTRHLGLIAKDQSVHVGCASVRCVFCYVSFDDMNALKNHECTADDLRCQQCGVISATHAKLCVHLFYHFKIMAMQCPDCEKQFVTERRYFGHVKTHTMPPRFSCVECSAKFTSNREYINHLYKHGVEKPHTCDKCERSFAARYQLLLHKETHQDKRTFQCSSCPKTFTKARTLQHHEFTFHSESLYSCEICSKVLNSPVAIRNHMATHGPRVFSCPVCNHAYASKGSAIRHMRIHSGELFKCDKCEYTTPYDFQLRSHKFTHEKEKPFQCSTCPNVGFLAKRSLEKHLMRFHNGEGVVKRRKSFGPRPESSEVPSANAEATSTAEEGEEESKESQPIKMETLDVDEDCEMGEPETLDDLSADQDSEILEPEMLEDPLADSQRAEVDRLEDIPDDSNFEMAEPETILDYEPSRKDDGEKIILGGFRNNSKRRIITIVRPPLHLRPNGDEDRSLEYSDDKPKIVVGKYGTLSGTGLVRLKRVVRPLVISGGRTSS